MPKFLFCGTYTVQGLEELRRSGAGWSRSVVQELVEAAGGTLESLYWAFGHEDLYCVADLPDTVAAGAVTLAVAMRGDLRLRTVVLETTDDVDAALQGASRLGDAAPDGA